MNSKRFELALKNLQSSDWRPFEKVASVFLSSEFDNLRTVASESGDGGRDAELYSSEDSKVMVQFSVSSDWTAKINHTVRRLNQTFPDTVLLIYATNQVIGADADELKKRIRSKHGVSLDIRDRSWFCERVNGNAARERSAEELATSFVDPYLSSYEVTQKVSQDLSSPESIAALTYLSLQWQDDAREKGLTKLAFEALVRSALVDTHPENRMSITDLRSKIYRIFPRHSHEELQLYIDNAIQRLGKNAIKKFPNDEYCLSHAETKKLNEHKAANILAENELSLAIAEIVQRLRAANSVPEVNKSELNVRLRSVTETVLFERSQSFAMAVQTGALAALADTDFNTAVAAEINRSTLPKIPGIDWAEIFKAGIREILLSDASSIQSYLRSLADTYTLMAFLQITPDVQRAVEKMFSHGTIWLDTTIILPLIADTLLDEGQMGGRFTRMIQAATSAGLTLYVTHGVLEEVERHMNLALTCARMPSRDWQGAVPYLLERYISSGRSSGSFSAWLDTFRGESRPLDDLGDYLRDIWEVQTRSLEDEQSSASAELRHTLELLWRERYERRQEKYKAHLDEMAISRLIRHDVECYAGVVALRKQEKSSPFGYSAWWLTVDRQTFDLKSKLRGMMAESPPDSPVMSADFLVNYLAIGPLRRRLSKNEESHLPLLMIVGNASQLTPELVSEADSIREKFKNLPERLIRRNVRDGLDQAKAKVGPVANLGMGAPEEVLDI